MKRILGLLLALVVTAGIVSNAEAAGFGVYGNVGSGSATWKPDYFYISYLVYSPDAWKADTLHEGIGFVLDTAVAKDNIFNYQLNAGYDKFSSDATAGGRTLDLRGVMMSHTFGFGIIRTSGLRVYLGPEIRLAWQNGSEPGYEYNLFGTGIGPALGINFNFSGNVTVAVKAGYQMMNYEGEADELLMGALADYDLEVDEKLVYLTVGLVFRSAGDKF